MSSIPKDPRGDGDRKTNVRYRVLHRTSYSYSTPVAMCQNQLKMTPQSLANVEVHASEVRISPTADSRLVHKDYFGNEVTTFAIEALHDELIVEVESDLTILESRTDWKQFEHAWESLASDLESPVQNGLFDVGEFTYPSPRIEWTDAIRSYALESFARYANLVDAAVDLTRRIHQDFNYDPTATHVGTSAREAFEMKAGVCQDFAHVQIACLRSIGLASRYVSGYLRTRPPPGEPKLVGADESHAWCSVYTGRQTGLLDLDPTNGCVVGLSHIPICFGRDYLDVSPMFGIAIGGGTPSLSVGVDVSEQPAVN